MDFEWKDIKVLDAEIMKKAQRRLDCLTKPLGSLGRLEGIIAQIAGITGNILPKIDKKCILIMCADNGVVEEGVSSCPKSVTSAVTQNFTKGFTCVNVLARHAGAHIAVVDIGVDDDIRCEGVIDRKIRRGTGNIAKEPAMTRAEAERAIKTGIDMVGEMKEKGYQLLGTGEMGIGNTTTSSAVASVLCGCDPRIMVGRGAGLSKDAFENKIHVVKRAIEINRPDPDDPIDVLAKVGGLDIAGLTGCFIGAGIHQIPILIDGFISASAALAAIKLNPMLKDYIFPSHGSAEPGNDSIMKALGYEPMLRLEMRVGEGTGAVLAFHILDAAFAAYHQMGTFEDAEIEQYVPQEPLL